MFSAHTDWNVSVSQNHRRTDIHTASFEFGKYANSISMTQEVGATKEFASKQVTESDITSTDCRCQSGQV